MTTQPSLATIGRTQNEPANLRHQHVANSYYRRAKLLHYHGSGLSVALALAAPVVLLLAPELGPVLGAAGGLWIFISKLVLDRIVRRLQQQGAAAQEQFDCAVLGLGRNNLLVPRPASTPTHPGHLSRKLTNWYATSPDQPWPGSVLRCQLTNIAWARRQHRAFGLLLAAAALGWVLAGIAIAIALDQTLTQYLITVALPSLPAILDATEMFRRHLQVARKRAELELKLKHLQQGTATAQDLREIQDQIYALRCDDPPIPSWFYRLTRTRYEKVMHRQA